MALEQIKMRHGIFDSLADTYLEYEAYPSIEAATNPSETFTGNTGSWPAVG